MDNKKDGGQAFPLSYLDKTNPNVVNTVVSDGMSLRDWFAGQALAGMAGAPGATSSAAVYAKAAYIFADEMIAARER
jgi:hypothetical protein